MIYITSKGLQKDIRQMNDFHLKAAFEKVQRISNHMAGFVHADTEDMIRYVEIIRINLWSEIDRRANRKP